MNFYDKFLWTCPTCFKRFKQKVTEEEIKERKEHRGSSHERVRGSSMKEFVTPEIKRTGQRSITVKEDSNMLFFSGLKKSVQHAKPEITVTAPEITPYIGDEPLTIERTETKPRSLLDILEERKKINNAKAKQDVAVKLDPYKENTFHKKLESEFVTEVKTVRFDEGSSALGEFNKYSKVNRDSLNGNESKIDATQFQTSFYEGSNVVNVVKRYSISKELTVGDGKDVSRRLMVEQPKKDKVLVRYQTSHDFTRTPEITLVRNTDHIANRIIEKRIVNEVHEHVPVVRFVDNLPLEMSIRKSVDNITQPSILKAINRVEDIKPRTDFVKKDTKESLEKFDINDYNIIKQIGEGSYGTIYLAEDKSRTKFAMKKIIVNSQYELMAIKSEFKLVHEVQHPNIMKLYGMTSNKLDITTFVLYILMELADYDWDYEIKQRLKDRRPYSESELKELITQLITSLAWLQKNNISHRDLKPQNVLCFRNGVYKLADFGEAKEVKINKQLSTIRGTELYMSPILFDALRQNKEDISHNSYKSDVFSLGYCIIYAASLNFNCLHEIREVKSMDEITRIINKYLKNKYSQNIINCLLKMIDIDENGRLDFIELETYIRQHL
jgi:RIO-like serine/threonine protein kinase